MSVLRCVVGVAGRRVAMMRPLAVPVRGVKEYMADPMEHATGIEKRELLALQSGNSDPFDTNIQKRGPGTKEKPNIVHSAFDSRIVGCICSEDSASVGWMWLHKGEPRRCSCGYWFKLEHKTPI